MAEFNFENIEWQEKKDLVEGTFMRIFTLNLSRESLSELGKFKVEPHAIIYPGISESKIDRKFDALLTKAFSEMTNKLTKKRAIFIHQNSGIPLIGSNAFGLVDRGTNIIEVKPITGCNLRCIYCSVDDDRRTSDYVVESNYLIQEFAKIASVKGNAALEAHIGTQGEPLLYSDLVPLVNGLSKIRGVTTISIDTNATMLTKAKVDELVSAGLTRFNVSINAMSDEIANTIAGCTYRLDKVKSIIRYISTVADLIIAPVLVPGFNEEEMTAIVKMAEDLKSKHKLIIGIQNYLEYKGGRRPGKSWEMDRFYSFLKELQKKHTIPLILSESDFSIKKLSSLPIVFKKDDIIRAHIVADGRMPGEKIAVAQDRVITFTGDSSRGTIKLKITRTKHNIYYGIQI